MGIPLQPVINIAQLTCEPFQQGSRYQSADAAVSELIGLTRIGAAYSEVPPGKSACPFHSHREEDEMFLILEGSGEYRFGDKTHRVKARDILGAPRGGPEFAHQITNTGTQALKYLTISSKAGTEICEYPDSGKFMIRSDAGQGASAMRFVGRLADQCDYWEDEEAT